MKIFTLIILSALLSSSACKTKEAKAQKDSENSEQTRQGMDKTNVIVDRNFTRPKDNKAITIQKSEINSNKLILKVEYSGGCEEHQFNIITSKMYKKSLPPQLDVFLQHVDHSDACREVITETLTFDIEKLKYPGNADELIINIHQGRDHPKKLSWKM